MTDSQVIRCRIRGIDFEQGNPAVSEGSIPFARNSTLDFQIREKQTPHVLLVLFRLLY